jgi:hypothetical protein
MIFYRPAHGITASGGLFLRSFEDASNKTGVTRGAKYGDIEGNKRLQIPFPGFILAVPAYL